MPAWGFGTSQESDWALGASVSSEQNSLGTMPGRKCKNWEQILIEPKGSAYRTKSRRDWARSEPEQPQPCRCSSWKGLPFARLIPATMLLPPVNHSHIKPGTNHPQRLINHLPRNPHLQWWFPLSSSSHSLLSRIKAGKCSPAVRGALGSSRAGFIEMPESL